MPKYRKTMNVAVDMEDHERWDKGKGPRRQAKAVRPEPEMPKVKSMICYDSIKQEDIETMLNGRRNIHKNKDGVRFIGYHVSYQTKDGEQVDGWMSEGDYISFRRDLFRDGKINIDSLEY